jgi:hypothetical protein
MLDADRNFLLLLNLNLCFMSSLVLLLCCVNDDRFNCFQVLLTYPFFYGFHTQRKEVLHVLTFCDPEF